MKHDGRCLNMIENDGTELNMMEHDENDGT